MRHVVAVVGCLVAATACAGPREDPAATSGRAPSTAPHSAGPAVTGSVTEPARASTPPSTVAPPPQASRPPQASPPPSALVTTSPPPSPAAVPLRYRGHWNLDAAACGSDQSEGGLLIEPGTVRFYESRGLVRSVAERAGVLELRLQMTGEGETWRETLRLQLSSDRGRLTTWTDDQVRTIRYRCS